MKFYGTVGYNSGTNRLDFGERDINTAFLSVRLSVRLSVCHVVVLSLRMHIYRQTYYIIDRHLLVNSEKLW